MSILDEIGLRVLVEEAVEHAVRKVLRSHEPIGDGDTWVSTAQLGTKYSIAQSTIRRWIREGKLEAKRAGKLVRVSLASFERLVANESIDGRRPLSPEELADRDEMREHRQRRSR